jgi:hypothetical protein
MFQALNDRWSKLCFGSFPQGCSHCWSSKDMHTLEGSLKDQGHRHSWGKLRKQSFDQGDANSRGKLGRSRKCTLLREASEAKLRSKASIKEVPKGGVGAFEGTPTTFTFDSQVTLGTSTFARPTFTRVSLEDDTTFFFSLHENFQLYTFGGHLRCTNSCDRTKVEPSFFFYSTWKLLTLMYTYDALWYSGVVKPKLLIFFFF